jgi:hypothetical protein
MQQHKLEFKGKISFKRVYYSEDDGQSYDMLFTGINVNRKWKPDATWFGEYANAYVQSTLAGAPNSQASHDAARVLLILVDSFQVLKLLNLLLLR